MSDLWDSSFVILGVYKQKGRTAMSWDIIARKGYYEVYANGDFMFSADTRGEAVKELEQWEREHIA